MSDAHRVNRLSVQVQHQLSDVLIDVDCSFELSGCTALFGPSGAGKSTLMRAIAGRLRPDSGKIVWHQHDSTNECWLDSRHKIWTAPHKRPLGFVGQNAQCFEHLSVLQNLEYAATRSTARGGAQNYSIDEVACAFSVEHLLSRAPNTLSGGEQQRAVLARALLTKPALLLLDEPLAALDATKKIEILTLLRDFCRRFSIPSLYVSHDLDEIAFLADQVALIDQGKMVAQGTTAQIIRDYALTPLGDQLGGGVIVETIVARHDTAYQLTKLKLGGGQLSMPLNDALKIDDRINIRIRPNDVAIATSAPSDISVRNALAGAIEAMLEDENRSFVNIRIRLDEKDAPSPQFLVAQITREAADQLALKEGKKIFALVKTASFERR